MPFIHIHIKIELYKEKKNSMNHHFYDEIDISIKRKVILLELINQGKEEKQILSIGLFFFGQYN